MMKVVLYRGIGTTNLNLFTGFVAQYEGKIVDLLKNSEYKIRYMGTFMLKADDLTRRHFGLNG
jgi:hypothetical protein